MNNFEHFHIVQKFSMWQHFNEIPCIILLVVFKYSQVFLPQIVLPLETLTEKQFFEKMNGHIKIKKTIKALYAEVLFWRLECGRCEGGGS